MFNINSVCLTKYIFIKANVFANYLGHKANNP